MSIHPKRMLSANLFLDKIKTLSIEFFGHFSTPRGFCFVWRQGSCRSDCIWSPVVIDDTKIKLEEDVTSASFSFPNESAYQQNYVQVISATTPYKIIYQTHPVETPPTPAMSIKEQISLERAKAQKTMAAHNGGESG